MLPWLVGAAGVLLALAMGIDGPQAAVLGVLANVAAGAAWAARAARAGAGLRPKVALSWGGAWALALGVAMLLVAWPMAAWRAGGGLGPVLALSAALAAMLVLAWRLAPAWAMAAHPARTAFMHAWADSDPAHHWRWRALQPAVAVTLLLVLPLLLAWPGLLVGTTRWVAAIAAALLLPVLHGVLQARRSGTKAAPLAPPARNAEPLALDAAWPELDAEADADAVVDLPPDLDTTALDGELYTAARAGRVERALALLDAGARAQAAPPAAGRDQRDLAVLAAVLPDLRLLRALIERGVPLNAPDAVITPLLAATRDSWHGRPDAVATLLANGSDARLADGDGNTPLHHAERSTDPGVAALLLDAAAHIDAVNNDAQTPLAVACSAGNWRLARFLLERGARVQPDAARPVLHAAAASEDDDPVGVQLLLKHKARVDAADANSRTALHAAAQAGHGAILQALVEAGAAVDARDDAGRTPLLMAARHGHADAVDVLVEAGADLGVRDVEGRTVLHHAVEGEATSPALLRNLLQRGADASVEAGDGTTALQRATTAGRWALVSALDPAFEPPRRGEIARDADADAVEDRAPYAVISDALLAGDVATLARFGHLLSPRDASRLLGEFAATQPARIDWLLARGADLESPTNEGQPLVGALLAKAPSDALAAVALHHLLARGAGLGGAGTLATFLHAATHARGGSEREALALLERGADPFGTDADGTPPLVHAVRLGWATLFERLLAVGVDPDTQDARGTTALHVATASGQADTVRRLVASGASPRTRAADGQTALGLALSSGRGDLAEWLDWRAWPAPGRPLRAADLPAAAIAGDAVAVGRLLNLGFDVDTVDAQGCTALLRAAGGGHAEVVEHLLAHGADPGRAAATGATPLSAAVSMRHGLIVDRLLAAGAQLEQTLPGNVTVLMLACALGLPELAARLIRNGANVHAIDAQGLGPIHCAALYGFTSHDRARMVALLDTLLLAGADASVHGESGAAPLLLLLGSRAEPGTACDEDVVLAGLERLLDEEIALDAKDPRGFGPLHVASLHGLIRVVQRLLRAGADPDARDRLNRTPREIAVMRGFVDVAAEFTQPPGGGVSMARFLRGNAES